MNVEDPKFESSAGLYAREFPQEHGKSEENFDPSDTYNAVNDDSEVSLEASLVRNGVSDIVESGSSQPQSRAAFRMSALEDYVDLDDDLLGSSYKIADENHSRMPESSSRTPESSSSSSSSPINAIGSTCGGSAASGFSFGVTSSGSAPVTTGFFSSSSSSTNAGESTGGATPVFSFGISSSGSAPVTISFFGSSSSSTSAAGGSTGGATPVFSFGVSSSGSSPVTINFFSSSSSTSAGGSTGCAAPVFGFGLSSSASSPVSNAAIFGSSPAPAFAASSLGNNYQMSAEDSMAEDPVQSTAPSIPVFGQANISPSTSSFMFGSSVPLQPNPFQFGGQPNQGVPQNPSMFQSLNSVEFNAGGGSFSLGSVGGDKGGRKIVKVTRIKNRKK